MSGPSINDDDDGHTLHVRTQEQLSDFESLICSISESIGGLNSLDRSSEEFKERRDVCVCRAIQDRGVLIGDILDASVSSKIDVREGGALERVFLPIYFFHIWLCRGQVILGPTVVIPTLVDLLAAGILDILLHIALAKEWYDWPEEDTVDHDTIREASSEHLWKLLCAHTDFRTTDIGIHVQQLSVPAMLGS